MKILYVNTSYYGGGAEKVARQLYEGMKEKYGVETYFLAGKAKKSKEVEVVYGNKLIPNVINEVISRAYTGIRFHDWYTTKRILEIVKNEHIDIVHFHNIHGNYIGIEDLKIISKYCKVVWTLHDMWALTGHCAYPLDCVKWRNDECRVCNNLSLYPPIKYDRAWQLWKAKEGYFVGNYINYVVPSEWLFSRLKESYLRYENIHIIENGVNIKQYIAKDKLKAKKKFGIPQDKIALIFSATDVTSPYKGVDVLMKALKMLSEKEKFFLIVIGNGDMPDEINEIDHIKVGVIKDESTMNDYLCAADLFIMPSRAENFPCSILESMASGTPVLGSRVGGIIEQVDEETGWIFENGNVRDLCNKLRVIWHDKEKLTLKSKACRLRAETIYSEEKMLAAYYELYAKLLGMKGGLYDEKKTTDYITPHDQGWR